MTGVSEIDSAAAPEPATAGLNDLDRRRAASLADEGGASGATLERQEPTRAPTHDGKGWHAAAFALGLLAAWRVVRRR